MNSLDVEVLRTAQGWLTQGRRAVLGTVVRTWGSSPRPPGSLMAIRDDGQVVGSVSGGCIEDDLVLRVRQGELALQRPQTTAYGASAEEALRFGLPCGGTVQLVLEPLGPQSQLGPLLQALEQHRRMQRHLDLGSGRVRLEAAPPGSVLQFDGQVLRTVHGPRARLLLIGGGQLARCLAAMAVMLDYAVCVCEPREEYHEGWSGLEGVRLSRRMPDDEVLSMQPDASSAVVAVSHDPKLDDLGLMEALRTPAFYVAAVGSLRNNASRRERLRLFDLDAADVARLRGPAGLRLGGSTPAEIALSVLAEMTAVQHGTDLAAPLGDWSTSTTVCRSPASEPQAVAAP
jgi:xanthine dehydrogenase accessory factor